MARVLHIEDDPKNRLLVQKLLRAAGHEVVDAGGGLEGLRLADTVSPDLVLVDINIPDLDGYEVILRLRGTTALSGVPIVAITAEGDRQSSLAVGADGFVQKPIDAKTFAKTIAKFLGGHREEPDGSGEARLRERSQRIVERLEKKVVELSEANRRLEEMARLRREFLQNVSHELATPMTPIVGYVRLLAAEELGPLTPLQRKVLESVTTSTQRLRSVVDTLLDVSSLDSGRMHFYAREYDFGNCVKQAIDEVKGVFELHRTKLTVAPMPTDLSARGDAEKVTRCIVHLLENAAKFTGADGEVAIEVRRHDGSIEVAIADSGPGVDRGELERVFEPFYQVDGSTTRKHGGVGLGLAFSRRVAEAMGGGVTIESPPSLDIANKRLAGTLVRLWVARRPPEPRLASSEP